MVSAAFAVDAERRAAPTRGGGVRIANREAAARDRVDEVDLGALEVADADRVHEQPDAVGFEHLITGATRLLNHEAVLKAGTAAALHEYPTTAAGLGLCREQLVDLRRCRGGHVDHGCRLLDLLKIISAADGLSKPDLS